MHYLEDYLELMKSLPKELQDGTKQLLMLDMEAEKDLKKLEERSKQFFESAEKKGKNLAGRDAEYQAIRGEYSKALSKSDDKVKLATQMHDRVGRHLKLLDQQINKLKMDLEAEKPGSAALLEKRFHEKLARGEAEEPAIKESGSHSRNEASSLVGAHSSGLVRGMSSFTPGAGSSRGGADDGSPVATTSSEGPTTKQTKESKSGKSEKKQAFLGKPQTVVQIMEEPKAPEISDPDLETVDSDYSDETHYYCICGDVSYGDMIACDNPECPREWFHYGCVGITSAPTGEWYCPICGGPAEA